MDEFIYNGKVSGKPWLCWIMSTARTSLGSCRYSLLQLLSNLRYWLHELVSRLTYAPKAQPDFLQDHAPSKSSVRVGLRIDRDVDFRGSKLLHHRVEIRNTKIDHPLLVSTTEITSVVRKGSKDRWTGCLRPRFLAVISAYTIDAQMLLIPLAQGCRIVRAEEQASNSNNMLHTVSG